MQGSCSTVSTTTDRISSSSPSRNPLKNSQPQTPKVQVHLRSTTGRKRAPRALTGKHIRPGTGASVSTLLSLRYIIKNKSVYCSV